MIPKIIITSPEGKETSVKISSRKKKRTKYIYEDLIYMNTGYYHNIRHIERDNIDCIIL